jgi:hypothetical protein
MKEFEYRARQGILEKSYIAVALDFKTAARDAFG